MEIFLIQNFSSNIIYEHAGYVTYFLINISLLNLWKDE